MNFKSPAKLIKVELLKSKTNKKIIFYVVCLGDDGETVLWRNNMSVNKQIIGAIFGKGLLAVMACNGEDERL